MDTKKAIFGTGFYALFRKLAPSRQLAILRYHAVCAHDAGYADPGICITPAAFQRHVDYLADNYQVLRLREAVAAIRTGQSLPANAVAITFDDGYADNLEAARVLAGRGLSATFYLTAGCLAGSAPFWPSELRALVEAVREPSIALRAPGLDMTLPVATPEQRRAAVARLTRVFKGHTIPVREALRVQLRDLAAKDVTSPMLTWNDVVAMQRMGMDMGSHTMTHPNLPNAGLEAARDEIVKSKARIEGETGIPVTMFSYPNGGAERYMTRDIAQLVREAGFDAATTSRNALASASSDLFALERVQVAEELAHLVFALEIERYVFKPKPRKGELDPA